MSSIDRLKPIQPGQPLSAAQANLINRLLKRNVTGPNVIEHAGGWHIRRDKKASGVGASIAVFEYDLEYGAGDAFRVKYIAGAEEFELAEVVKIAKAWLNRITPFNGITYNGVAYNYVSSNGRNCVLQSDSTVTWFEEMTPPYVYKGIIHAIKCSEEVTLLDGIEWLEIGARTWAQEYEEPA